MNKEVGEALGISKNTVSSHMKEIVKKFGVKRRTDLARFYTLLSPRVRPGLKS